MNILKIRNDLIFIVTPKAANSSIKHALKVWLGEEGPLPKDLHRGWQFAPRLFDEYVIATVRNPFDRLVSCYEQKVIGDGASSFIGRYGFYKHMPFDEFVKRVCGLPDERCDHHFKPMHYHIPRYDYLLRFETIDEQWPELQEMFGFPDLPHLNASPERSDYETYYTPELIDMVNKKYAKDLELYDYEY